MCYDNNHTLTSCDIYTKSLELHKSQYEPYRFVEISIVYRNEQSVSQNSWQFTNQAKKHYKSTFFHQKSLTHPKENLSTFLSSKCFLMDIYVCVLWIFKCSDIQIHWEESIVSNV